MVMAKHPTISAGECSSIMSNTCDLFGENQMLMPSGSQLDHQMARQKMISDNLLPR